MCMCRVRGKRGRIVVIDFKKSKMHGCPDFLSLSRKSSLYYILLWIMCSVIMHGPTGWNIFYIMGRVIGAYRL